MVADALERREYADGALSWAVGWVGAPGRATEDTPRPHTPSTPLDPRGTPFKPHTPAPHILQFTSLSEVKCKVGARRWARPLHVEGPPPCGAQTSHPGNAPNTPRRPHL